MESIELFGQTIFADDEKAKKFEEEQKKRMEEIAEQALKINRENQFPERFWNCSFDNYITKTNDEISARQICMDFAEGKGKQGLLILGDYGTGKTHLVSSVIRKKGGLYITSFELCLLFQMGADWKAEQNRLQVLQKYAIGKQVIVIDEIGRGDIQTEKLILPYLINEWYGNKTNFILVSNLKGNEFMRIVGMASIDRMKEIAQKIEIHGESKRGQKCD